MMKLIYKLYNLLFGRRKKPLTNEEKCDIPKRRSRMKTLDSQKIIDLHTSIAETLLYFYKINSKDLEDNPEILKSITNVNKSLFKLNDVVNKDIEDDQISRTRIVEKKGRIFTVIDGDRK